ncbi:MAG: ABC transporter permease subunit [Actinomycetota bacterium]
MTKRVLRVAWQSIKEQKKAFFGWGIGVLALVLITVLFYPSIKGQESFNDITKNMPDAVKALMGGEDLVSPVGYINSQLFQSMLPALFLIFAIGRGTEWIAGEEKKGILEMLLANPVSRSRVVFERSAALAVSVALLGAVLFVALAGGARLVSLDIGIYELLSACLSVVLLGIAFGEIGLLLGAFSGRKGFSSGIAAGIAVAGFLIATLAPVVDVLEAFERFSPFYYYLNANPLSNGLDPLHAVVLIAIALVATAAAAAGFERRDLAT